MRAINYILFGLLFLSNQSVFAQYGKVVIAEQPMYEQENSYFPHDYFVSLGMPEFLKNPVSIKITSKHLVLENTYNNGFTGHRIWFLVSPNLEIKDVKYEQWDDMNDESETTYKVEKVIFSISENPFGNQFLTGHYTLQIREDYTAGKILKKEGVKDNTSYRIFNGKFKIYSEQEKQRGRDWVIDNNERMMGVKDSLGVYRFPDHFAEYKFGFDSLSSVLKQFEINRSDAPEERRDFVTLSMLVNENGIVETGSMFIMSPMKSMDLLNKLKDDRNLTTNWYPATYNGKPVKSEVHMHIGIK